jgi:hypothetical protein
VTGEAPGTGPQPTIATNDDNLANPSSSNEMRPVERVLGRLEQVRQVTVDSWVARCTSHEDQHPSLSIKETPDGTVLVRCRAGCSSADIVRNAGLAWADLFPAGSRERQRPRRWMGAVPIAAHGRPALVSFGDDVVAAWLGELGRLAYTRNRLDKAALMALNTLAGACGSSKVAVREHLAAAIAGDAS